MRQKKITLVLLLLLLPSLVACYSHRGFDQKLGSWVGSTESSLVSAMGAPTETLSTRDGGAVHTWVLVGSDGVPDCTMSFTIGPAGLVKSYSYRGKGCKS